MTFSPLSLFWGVWGLGGVGIIFILWKSCIGGLLVVYSNIVFDWLLVGLSRTSHTGLLNACLMTCLISVDQLAWIAAAHSADKFWGSASYIGGISTPVLYRAAHENLGLYIYKVPGQVWYVWEPYSSCCHSHENSSKQQVKGPYNFIISFILESI